MITVPQCVPAALAGQRLAAALPPIATFNVDKKNGHNYGWYCVMNGIRTPNLHVTVGYFYGQNKAAFEQALNEQLGHVVGWTLTFDTLQFENDAKDFRPKSKHLQGTLLRKRPPLLISSCPS